MKKLVTIRKARKGEKPGFVNKTAKFLKKAEMGTEVQSESGEYNEKILAYVAEQILELGQEPKAVYETLVESKIEPEMAAEHVQAILQFQQNMQQEEQTQQPVDQETAYSEAADEVKQDLAADYGYYNPSGQGTGLAQDTQEEDTANEEADQMVTDIVNNEWTGQDGGVIDQYIVNNYLPVLDDSSQDDFNAFNYREGGNISKKKFMKGVMSELKKAREGMQQEQESPENQKFDMTDTLLLDRSKKKDKFVSALSKTTQEAKDKERAEQMWQQQQMMMQQPQSMDPSIPMLNKQKGGDTEHPYHHLAMMQQANQEVMGQPMNTMLTAKGGITMPSPREYRKMHRQVSRMLPNIYLDPNIKASELNVTKTGLLGRPKEYSIKFQGNQGIMPGWGHGTLLLGLPGGANVGPNMFGGRLGSGNVSYTKGIVETRKRVYDGTLRKINSQADPQKNSEKAKLYPESSPYSGVADSPAPAGTEITKDELGRDIAISPEEAKRREEQNKQAWQFYSPNSGPNQGQFTPKGFGVPIPVSSSGSYFPNAAATYDPYQQTLTYPDGRVVNNPSSEEIQKAITVSGPVPKQYGGFVDPDNPDLYKFIYGGGDNMFEDDMNTVNTADPYFGRMYREGGMPSFEGGGMWVTRPDGTTIFLKDDGSVDKNRVMTDDEKKTYDETTLKGHQDYYTKNKNQFVNQSEQQKMIDDAVNQRMRQYTSQYGQPGRMQSSGNNSMPGYRSNGFLDQLFSANLTPEYLGTWSKMKDVRTSTGQPFTGFNKNMVLNEVDVRRSGMRGQPKAYTMKFNQYRDPRDANKITLNPAENRANDPAGFNAQGTTQPGTGTSDKALQPRGTYRDLGLFDQMRIRANERQTDRRAGDEPDVDPGNQPMSNEEMLKSQGKVWSEQQKRWVQGNTVTPKNSQRDAIINAPNQQSNIHSFPGPDMSNIPSGTNVGQDEALKALFNSRMAYGGYIPTFNPGGPVSYTNNPAFVGKSNIDLLSENSDVAVPGLQPSSFWNDSQSFNAPKPTIFDNCTEAEKQDPNSPCYDREQYGYQVDPNQQISDTLKKDMMEKTGEVEIDMKNKNAFALDAEAYLAAGNKLASIFPGIKNRRESNKRLGNKKLKKTADALYANNPAGDPWQSKGQTSTSGSTYGLMDPRNQGQINYSGASQSGGAVYKEGGVAYMTADEMQRFMEAGGQIEFI